jgi:hypothetical protein
MAWENMGAMMPGAADPEAAFREYMDRARQNAVKETLAGQQEAAGRLVRPPSVAVPTQPLPAQARPAPLPGDLRDYQSSSAAIAGMGGQSGTVHQNADGSWARGYAPMSDTAYLQKATGNNPSLMYDPATRQQVMNEYLGIQNTAQQGRKDKVAAFQKGQDMANQREQFFRDFGLRSQQHSLDQAKFGMAARESEYKMSPERNQEAARLSLMQNPAIAQKIADGTMDSSAIGSINDAISKLHPSSLGQGQAQAAAGPRFADVTEGVRGGDFMAGPKVLGTMGAQQPQQPGEAPSGRTKAVDWRSILGNSEDAQRVKAAKSPMDAVQMLHQMRGGAWLGQNWPAVKNALVATDPNAVDKLSDQSETGAVSKVALSPIALVTSLGGLFNGNGYRNELSQTINTPAGESLRRFWDKPNELDKTQALIRYLESGVPSPDRK